MSEANEPEKAMKEPTIKEKQDIKQNLQTLSKELTSDDYKLIRGVLVSKKVITFSQKAEIDKQIAEEQPSILTDTLLNNLDKELLIKYRGLLQTMKESGNSRLEQMAKNLETPIYTMEDLEKKYEEEKAPRVKVNYHELNSEQKQFLPKVQALIIVVNESEFKATMCNLKPPPKFDDHKDPSIIEVTSSTEVGFKKKTFIFYIGMFGKCPVAVGKVEPGRGRDAIDHIKLFPNIVLIAAVGVTAGFPENNVHYGDVIISKQITDCSTYKIQDGTYIPRGLDSSGCQYMINALGGNFEWKFMCSKDARRSLVILGQVLSRPVLLNSEKERKMMLTSFGAQAKGYEMEGYSITGFGIDCIIIKGVCDFASGKTKEWQPTAALAANDCLYYQLNQLDLSGMKRPS